MEGFGDVVVFTMSEARVAIDDGHAAAEAAHGLGEFETDKTASQDEEMLGDAVEFEGFDVARSTGWPLRAGRA